MKSIAERYRPLSIWLSLLIISLAFVIGSDESSRWISIPAAFGLGALLYLLGGIREWSRGRVPAVLMELFLSALMLSGALLSFLYLGGYL